MPAGVVVKLLRNLLTLLVVACATASAGPINISGARCFGCASDPGGGGGDVPAWAETPFAGFWDTISLNTMADVDPNPGGGAAYEGSTGFTSLTDAWAGGWILPGVGDFGTYGVGPNGGHADYHGNAVIAFDLATQLWSRHTDPYATPSWPDADGWWPNESPAVVHTYQQVMGIPELNAIFLPSRQTLDSPSQWISAPAMYDFDTGQWTKMATYGGSGNPTMSEGWGAYDSTRNIVWLRGGDTGAAFASFDYTDGATGSWDQHGFQDTESGTMAAYDPINDFIAVLRVAGGNALHGIDPDDPDTFHIELTESGRPSLNRAMGIVYSTKRAAFIVWNDGESVYELKKGSGSWQSATWTYTLLTHASNTLAPARNPTGGVYSKLQRIAYDDREFLIHAQQTDGPVYAFEIP